MNRVESQPESNTHATVPNEATLLRLLVDAARDFAIFAVKPDGTILTWNPGVRHITGYEEDEFIGQNCAILFTPEDRETGQPERERETAKRDGQSLDERWHMKKDGTRFWGGFMHALRDDRNVLVGCAKILRDMTPQKRYEEELEARVQERTKKNLEAQRRLLTAQEEERYRFSRELHDNSGQHLAALSIELGLLDNTAEVARAAAANARRTADDAARLASEAAQTAAEAVSLAARSDALPEASKTAEIASQAARAAAATMVAAAAAVAAADMALAAVTQAAPGVARLHALSIALSQDLHRLAVDLRPTSLDDLGLVAALRAYAMDCAATRAGAVVTVDTVGLEDDGGLEQRVPPEVETALYRIVQEALTNVSKHAVPGGGKRVSVTLHRIGAQVVATIEDDGPGFDVDEVAGRERLGLSGMRERAALLGGTVEVESAPGEGTTVYARIPLTPSPNS